MPSDSDLHETRTNAVHSETADEFRVSYESESVVYFLGAPNGLVKIGFATNFDERLGKLVCGSPVPLEVLTMERGGRVEERHYHTRFAAWRRHGEWFELVPEIQAEIDRINDDWNARVQLLRVHDDA